MEKDGIPTRRSSRMQVQPPLSPLVSSPTPEIHPKMYELHKLPVLGPDVQTILLLDMEIEFNGDYRNSQEETRGHYSSKESAYTEV